MKRWQSCLVALVAIAGGFFEQGCAVRGMAGEAALAALEKGKEWVKNEVAAAAPALEEKLLAAAEKKLAEQEQKSLASIDAQLVPLGILDMATGVVVTKTWKDFDADHNGHLEPGESLRVAAYITTEGWKKVQAGQMDKSTFIGMEKNTGIAVTALGAVQAGMIGIQARRRKRQAAATAPAPTPAAGAP